MIELFRDKVGYSVAIAVDQVDLITRTELLEQLQKLEAAFPFVILKLLCDDVDQADIVLLNEIQAKRRRNEGGILVVAESENATAKLATTNIGFPVFASIHDALSWLFKVNHN
jgi:hypothetical protein